jgi:hypothetical protein
MRTKPSTVEADLEIAREKWGPLTPEMLSSLASLIKEHQLSVSRGDLLLLNRRWYVTHAGLLRLARRKHCTGIRVSPVDKFCDPSSQRWAFKGTVYRSKQCRGFVGYGDADPSNVSALVRGAEMRVAETRAVNRALRKAYGIGIYSVHYRTKGKAFGSLFIENPPRVINYPVGDRPSRARRCPLGSEAQDIFRAVVQLAYSETGAPVSRSRPPIVM